MKTLFLTEIKWLPYVADEGTQFGYIMSIIRSTIQYCSFSAIEYLYKHSSRWDEIDYDSVKSLTGPSDGSFIAVLDKLLPEIRNTLWPGCADSWFMKQEKNRDGKPLVVGPIAHQLNEWVRFRNNRPGHGVVDTNTISTHIRWLYDLAQNVVIGLGDLLPIHSNNDELRLKTPNEDFSIETIKLINGAPIVIRDIRNRGSLWRVRYQTLDIIESGID